MVNFRCIADERTQVRVVCQGAESIAEERKRRVPLRYLAALSSEAGDQGGQAGDFRQNELG